MRKVGLSILIAISCLFFLVYSILSASPNMKYDKFNEHKWKQQKDTRYLMKFDLVNSGILKDKKSNDVILKLGEPTYKENNGTLVYKMGPYYPDDYGPHVLFVEFKKKQVDTVYYYQP